MPIARATPRDLMGDLAVCRGLRDGDDEPFLLEFNPLRNGVGVLEASFDFSCRVVKLVSMFVRFAYAPFSVLVATLAKADSVP